MDELTSPTGSLGAAIVALLIVFGYRLARPSRGREWLALAGFAGGLAAQYLGAGGLLPGRAFDPGAPVRLAGAALLVVGLVVAGRPTRARRRTADPGAQPSSPPGRGLRPVYAGLALVLVGQLARGPSVAGAVATVAAVMVVALASPGRS